MGLDAQVRGRAVLLASAIGAAAVAGKSKASWIDAGAAREARPQEFGTEA